MRDFEKLSDDELSVLLSQEVTAAFHEIFNRYWSQLYATAYKRVRSKEAAEEIVQDLFTSLWVKRSPDVKNRLCTFIHNHCGKASVYLHSPPYAYESYYSRETIRRARDR